MSSRPTDSRARSITKAISWRLVGTVDTFCVSLIVLTLTGATHGDAVHSVRISGGIAGVEVVTKILLYYLHERAWQRVPIGWRAE